MAAKIYRINYKSDFIMSLHSDAGWMTPFCIKFWTGAPSLAYFVGWDGTTYTHCTYDPSEPTELVVQFDDHHLPIGDLKYQVAYHFTVADFPDNTEDEVINPGNITTEIDGETYQVMLDFTGETAPEIQFALPAYANELQRIVNEQQRIADEQTRINNEETRISNEQTRLDNEAQRIRNEQTRITQEEARVREFATLKNESQEATTAANNAAALANQKAQLAADKAQLAADKAALAQDAATLANEKAQLAADKAELANNAAQLADDKAALAQQKAEYAQAQGDYAKTEADAARDMLSQIGVFDVSIYNASGGVLATYASLTAALAAVPSEFQIAALTIKFVNSTSGKYEQYRLTSTTWSTTVSDWQGVDDVPTDGSNNLVKSGGVFSAISNVSEISKETIPFVLSNEENIAFVNDEETEVCVEINNNGINAKSYRDTEGNEIIGKSTFPFTEQDGIAFGNDEETEEYVEINSSGIKAKAYYDMNGNLVNLGLPITVVDRNGKGDYTTIAEAITNTDDDDVILVMPGIYEESIHAFGKKRHIVGLDKETCILTNGTGNYLTPPLEMSIGSIKNMTIIADNYDPTIDNPAENPNAHPSYGIHIEYANSTPYTFTIQNCKIVSKWCAAVGIGLRYNQTINIIDCELISESVRVHSSWSNKWVLMGGLYFHNDATQSTNKGTGKISVRNSIIKGYACAITAQSVVGYPSLAEAEFIGNTASSTLHGVGSDNVYRWDYETSPGMWSGEYISLAITSHGNNLSEMNYINN